MVGMFLLGLMFGGFMGATAIALVAMSAQEGPDE